MKESIFHTEVEMPPKGASDDIVRSAMTPTEVRQNYTPTVIPNRNASVWNLPPVNRGKHY